MPRYDYLCETCKHEFEVFHDMNAEGPKKCPECGVKKVRRAIARPAFHSRYSPMHPRANRGRGH